MRPSSQPLSDTLLVIDTATEACSIALFDRGALVASDHAVLGRGHAERLVPRIAALPDRGRADAILVNCGPGSFTGVRVGLAAARALALAWRVPLHGYATHDLVAAMAQADLTDRHSIDVAMTGGHGEFFVQRFDDAGRPTGPLQSLAPEAAIALCTSQIVAGSQAEALVALRGFGTAIATHPDARAAMLLDTSQRQLPPDPVYGRAPDATPQIIAAPALASQ